MERTPEQQIAISTVGHSLCVDAGAGSGKTSVLIGRVLHILEQRLARLDEIVAITFTDKAAAEMRERLRHEFHRRAPADDPEAMNFWRDLERRAESARFSTIHSFCTSLLRENALALQADPDFAVLADAETFLLREEVIERTLHALLAQSDEDALRAATELGMARLQDLLRGLLKQRGLLRRISGEHPLHDPEALAVHWEGLVRLENKRRCAALTSSIELHRVRRRLAAFDGQCLKPDDAREVLRRDMVAATDRILQGMSVSVIHKELQALADAKARGVKKNWPAEAAYDALKEAQDELRDLAKRHLPPQLDAAAECGAAQLTCAIHATYLKVETAFQTAKAGQPAYDFDDLILGALIMLREHPETRQRTARGIRFLLIDEFQDTDDRQLEMARLLANEADGPELFIVGDAKQSIYGFRGAEVEVFLDARTEAAQLVSLERNFRSVPDVLEFVNDFFAQTHLLEAVEAPYRPLRAHRPPVHESRVEFLLPDPEENAAMDAHRSREAALIADRLLALCEGEAPGTVLDPLTGLTRPANFGDVAMLFRSMSSVYLYEQALRERSIPFTVVAGAGFHERTEVLDLRNLLTVLVDPLNEVALLGVLRSPLVALSDDTLMHLALHKSLLRGFYDLTLSEDFPQRARVAQARRLIQDLRNHIELPLPALLHRMLETTGYEAILLRQFLGVQKALNVRKLLDLADDFARTRTPNLSAFVRYLDEVAAESEIREGDAVLESESSGAVTLMTIHKSKGLEFPIVVIPDLGRSPKSHGATLHRRLGMAVGAADADGETAYPQVYTYMKEDDAEQGDAESARILYVAMTRARDWLFLSGVLDTKKIENSWLETAEECYALSGRADGEAFAGESWQAVVRHTARPQTKPTGATPLPAIPGRDTVLQRIAPVLPYAPGRITFSVSELLNCMCGAGDREDPMAAMPDEHAFRPHDAADRGTLVHRLFQRWDFVMCEEAVVDQLLQQEYSALDGQDRVRGDLLEIARRFRGGPLWNRVVSDPNAQRELSFLFRVDDALLSGTVDMLLSDGTLVDYKTGRPKADLQDRYRRQLQVYAAAVRDLTQQAPRTVYLYYADTGELGEVECSPAALNETLTRARDAIQALRARTQ